MRHRARARKFGRTSSHRLAMYRNMVTSLLEHGRVETTDAKAKEVRRIAERMITLGKRGTLHARRRALRVIRSREVAARVFGDLAERFRERPGGYTRVLKLRRRIGDAAPLSILELVEGGAEAAEAGGKAATRKRGEKAEKPRKGAAAAKEPTGKGARRQAAAEAAGRKARAGGKGKGKPKGGEVAARKPAAPRKTGRSSKSD
jgi:large subunit ribosomal protein L17